MMVKVSVDQQAWLSKMKLAASQEAELNEDEDILNLKVN